MSGTIEITGLTKNYNGNTVLSDLDLEVRQGEIYGFLGPNGAGKTTAIKTMLGLIRPDHGKIMIDGINVAKESRKARKKIGYLPERVSLYEHLSVRENLNFLCELNEGTKGEVERLLSEFQLKPVAEKKVSTLSKGQVQRVGLAQSMIGGPDILILDEPTSGLDPNIRNWIKEKIIGLKEGKKTIFLSNL